MFKVAFIRYYFKFKGSDLKCYFVLNCIFSNIFKRKNLSV